MVFTASQGAIAEQARALMQKKAIIEGEIEVQITILKANNCDMRSLLVDMEGFPRADIDIYAVRGARVRIIELRNDLASVIDSIAKALQGVYDPSLGETASPEAKPSTVLKPFAKVDGVAPSSPAMDAGLRQGDLIVKFGQLDGSSFTSTSMQSLADLVAASEDVSLPYIFEIIFMIALNFNVA